MLCYLDEFGNLGHIPGFERWVATVRSARVGCLLVVQDTAQLVATYGEPGAAIILTKVSRDDAEYFSKLTGERTALSTSHSASRALLLPWADRGNRGAGEVARPVLTPAELRTLGDAALVVSQDRQPLVQHQRPWFLVPALAGEGDALAVCRPVTLPDPRATADPVMAETESAVIGAGDRPFAAPVESPADVDGIADGLAVPMVPTVRARPARAKRSRTVVRPVAVPIEAEAVPITMPMPIVSAAALPPARRSCWRRWQPIRWRRARRWGAAWGSPRARSARHSGRCARNWAPGRSGRGGAGRPGTRTGATDRCRRDRHGLR